MKISYKVSTPEGKIVKGVLEARDTKEAVYFLRNKDYLPIEVQEKEEQSISSISSIFSKQKQSDVILFTRQLSSMLTSGLTLMQALHVLKDQMQNQTMKGVVNDIIAEIQEGKPFSNAIAKYPKVFSPIYISLVKAAETSGFLEKILQRLADNLEKAEKLRGTIKSALMYPVIVVILMIAVLTLMMLFVIPQLSTLYESLNVPLPFATRVVIGISNFTIKFWPLVLITSIIIFFVYRRWSGTPDGKRMTDRLVLKLPLFGKIISESILAEFSRTFGLMVAAGTLVVGSLQQSSEVAGNVVYREVILHVAQNIEKGITIGDAMSNYDLFPPILVEMVKIGEQTGKLDESLLKASEYFEREVEGRVKTLTTALEPFIMIVLGLGVAFLVISIITPIYKLTSAIK